MLSRLAPGSAALPARPSRWGRVCLWGARLAGVGLLLAAPALAAGPVIRGRVVNFEELRNPVWEEAKDPKRRLFSFREIVPTVGAQHRQLYPHIPKELCLAALAAAPQPAPRGATLIRVGGGRTTPVTIVVTPGTRLRFKNTDPFRHRLYGVGVQDFAPNTTARDATRDWTVPSPGSFEIRDELAPSLRMWIVAEPRVAAVGYPNLAGTFALRPEQPGDYTVQAYFSGKKVGTAVPVTLAAADVDLSKTPMKVAPDPGKPGNAGPAATESKVR